jgi:hypothetical protein
LKITASRRCKTFVGCFVGGYVAATNASVFRP